MVDVVVTPDGQARFGNSVFACALGKAGVTVDKREGDLKTPVGAWPVLEVFYRPDRLLPPVTRLPCRALSPQDGWCDDPASPEYNRLVRLPFAASHEKLWRDDHLYDLILVLGYNDAPPVPGRGSAIFAHVRRDDGTGTEGCVAFALTDLLSIVAGLTPESRFVCLPEGNTG